MTPPILSVVGCSNSGKTTLIERVIPELTRMGYRVATVKHAGHGFDLDTEGKDSWRHKRAGAGTVVVVSKGSLAMFADVPEEMNVEDVRERFLDGRADLIIAEGWKGGRDPKIVVVRERLDEVNVSGGDVLAVVSTHPIDTAVPCIDRDDIAAVVTLIMRHYPRPAAFA